MPALGAALRKALSLSLSAEHEPRISLVSGVKTTSGEKISPESAMRSVAVYASTSLIATAIARLPVRFVRVDDPDSTPQMPEAVRALWLRPNPDQSRISFYETLLLSMLLWGNFYGFIRRNGRGDVVEVWPLDPERITRIQRIDEDGKLGLEFEVANFGWIRNRPGALPEMLHIPALTLPGRIEGLSPIKQAMEAVGVGLSAEQHAARFLGDGIHMSGTIETPEDLAQGAAEELWENFQRLHAGPKKAGRVAILTAGAKYNSIAIPPAELQFLEQMKYSDSKIAMLYRVPPHMVSDVERSTSWGTGIQEQTKGFVDYTLSPWIEKVANTVVDALIPGQSLRMEFDTDPLLRGRLPERAEVAGVLIRAGFEPADAARVAGLPAMSHTGGLPVTTRDGD